MKNDGLKSKRLVDWSPSPEGDRVSSRTGGRGLVTFPTLKASITGMSFTRHHCIPTIGYTNRG